MLEKIYEEHKGSFSRSDFKIMECLIRNQHDLQHYTTAELTATLGVSSSTLSRFWTKIGFRNLNSFKRQMYEDTLATPSSRTFSAKKQMEGSSSIHELYSRFEQNLALTEEEAVDAELDQAASDITHARNIYVFAPDASEGLFYILAYRCRRLGFQMVFLPGGSALYESMINIGPRDLIIIFCFSRVLAETQVLLKHSQNIGCKTILFTDLLTAPELSMAGLILYSYRGEPGEYHSMIAPMALIDMLIMKLIRQTGDAVPRARYLESLREKYAGILRR